MGTCGLTSHESSVALPTRFNIYIGGFSDRVRTVRRFRVPMMRLAEHHAARTPHTYVYLFTWRSPALDGRLGAAHGFEVPFVFGTLDSLDAREFIPDGAPVGQLSEHIRDAWIAFARAGNPNNPAIPHWPAYTVADRTTMVFDAQSRAARDFRGDERKLVQSAGGRDPL